MEQADFLATFPLARWVLLNNVLERHPIRRYTQSVSLLYILAEMNLSNLIRIHPRAKSYLDVENERYGTPLFAALATDSRKAIEAFADVQSHLQPQGSLSPVVHREVSQSMKRCAKMDREFDYSHTKGVLSYIERHNDEGFLAFFLNAGLVEANTICSSRRDALSYAAERGYENVFTILLASRCINIESKDALDRTPLFYAAEHGHEKIVQQLLENGANIELQDFLGYTPLIKAAQNGHEKIVRQLLEKGANIELQDSFGYTPLIKAAQNGHEKIVQQLLEKGAVVESKTNKGWTALMWAAGQENEKNTQQLLEKGAVVESKTNDGWTALHSAARHGRDKNMQQLLEFGADVNSKDNSGVTPLMSAAIFGQKTSVQLLLQTGINADSNDEMGQSPPCQAAKGGCNAKSHQVHVDAKDNMGGTALGWSAKIGHATVAQLLLDRGAEVESRSAMGCTTLSYAAPRGHEAVARLLLDHGAEVDSKDVQGCTPLFDVASCKTFTSDNDRSDDEKATYLRLTVDQNSLQKACLELYGTGTPAKPADQHELPELVGPVFLSTDTQQEMIKLLLEKGADVRSQNISGETPLSHAEENNFQNVVRLLRGTSGVELDSNDKESLDTADTDSSGEI